MYNLSPNETIYSKNISSLYLGKKNSLVDRIVEFEVNKHKELNKADNSQNLDNYEQISQENKNDEAENVEWVLTALLDCVKKEMEIGGGRASSREIGRRLKNVTSNSLQITAGEYIKRKFGSLRALFLQEADVYVLEQLKGTKEYLVNLKNNSV